MKTRKIAFLGICTAVAMIFSFIESQIPSFVAIPGIKMGLANIAIIVILYKMGWKEAIIVNLIRVLLTSFIFGSVMTLAYSAAGATLSLCVMILLKKCKWASTILVSVAGGICHNIGQILVALFVTETSELLYYLPALLISGTITGILIGLIGALVVKKLEKFQF